MLEYRRAGGTFRDIASRIAADYAAAGRADDLPLGWDERYAYKDLSRELERLRSDMETDLAAWRDIELDRLEVLHSRLWPIALGTEQVPPDLRAVESLRRLMERRAHLLGLDAAQRHELSGPGGEPVQVIDFTPAKK